MQNLSVALTLIVALFCTLVPGVQSTDAEPERSVAISPKNPAVLITAAEPERTEVEISPKCAAVLITSTTAVGVGVAYALTPAMLCGAGFCPVGVAKGSFAASWQSTMPLVAKGSVFAALQSAAMGGAGIKTTVAAAAVGGGTGALLLHQLCSFVDKAHTDSALGPLFENNLMLVQKVGQLQKDATEACAGSPTCSSAVEASSSAAENLWTAAVAAVSAASDSALAACASSEACRSVAEASSSAWDQLWISAAGTSESVLYAVNAISTVADVARQALWS